MSQGEVVRSEEAGYVQESLLAVPYAMARLDSIGRAADYYLQAIDTFHEEAERIDRTIARVEQAFATTTLAELIREPSGSMPLCPGPVIGSKR